MTPQLLQVYQLISLLVRGDSPPTVTTTRTRTVKEDRKRVCCAHAMTHLNQEPKWLLNGSQASRERSWLIARALFTAYWQSFSLVRIGLRTPGRPYQQGKASGVILLCFSLLLGGAPLNFYHLSSSSLHQQELTSVHIQRVLPPWSYTAIRS